MESLDEQFNAATSELERLVEARGSAEAIEAAERRLAELDAALDATERD